MSIKFFDDKNMIGALPLTVLIIVCLIYAQVGGLGLFLVISGTLLFFIVSIGIGYLWNKFYE